MAATPFTIAGRELMTTILSAKELMTKIALAESEKASAALKVHAAAEAEKEALLDKMRRPSGLSDDEILEKAAIIVNRAVENGHSSVQVYRFPHTLCAENGWEKTLTGAPREIYEFWKRQLEAKGYHLRCEIIDYPGGMPGDIGITL